MSYDRRRLRGNHPPACTCVHCEERRRGRPPRRSASTPSPPATPRARSGGSRPPGRATPPNPPSTSSTPPGGGTPGSRPSQPPTNTQPESSGGNTSQSAASPQSPSQPTAPPTGTLSGGPQQSATLPQGPCPAARQPRVQQPGLSRQSNTRKKAGFGIVLLVVLVGMIGSGSLLVLGCQDQAPTSPFAALADPTPSSAAPSGGDPSPMSTASSGQDADPQRVTTSAETDRQVLTNIFHATNGEEWDDTATWASERPLGDWYGVTTNDVGRVIELHLATELDPEESYNGEILSEIYKLDELRSLYLFLRGIPGRIPRELGQLSELRHLDINGNELRGEIPSELGHLSQLERMNIYGPTLEGAIPQEIFELTKLQELRIEGENLQVEVSDAVETLALNGVMVNLQVESLTGCVSDYAYQWVSNLFVSDRTGAELPVCEIVHEEDLNAIREIFNEWGAHGSMSNWLTRLPFHEWEGITTNRNGRVVRLEVYLGGEDGPRLSSTIPEAIGRLTALEVLGLNSNGLGGEIPGWIEDLSQLKELQLSSNDLSGEVPPFLSAMPNIWWIDLHGNRLTGCLPKPAEKPLPPDLRGPLTEGPDGRSVIPMGVPELSGVEYCASSISGGDGEIESTEMEKSPSPSDSSETIATPEPPVSTPPSSGTSSTASGIIESPLTAQFLDFPASHDGQTEFTFELRFSEEFELSYKTLRDHSFTVDGGEVKSARRLEKPGNIRWEITIRPDGNGAVTVVLPETTDCTAQGTLCTGDGRKLSTRTELSVPGPK